MFVDLKEITVFLTSAGKCMSHHKMILALFKDDKVELKLITGSFLQYFLN